MPKANKLNIYVFGQQLLTTNDLDPVYVLLWNAQLPTPILWKWLLAYWAFYHVGTASWITTDPNYWERFFEAAGSKEFPRSSERRHYRGSQAIKSADYLKHRGLEQLKADITGLTTADQVIDAVKQWRGFGPWIAFKVADMLDRLNICSLSFSTETILYDSPRKAAEILQQWERATGEAGPWALERVVQTLKNHTAPPRHERPIGYQEAETILCKWKSYLRGHYTVGEDVEACHKALHWKKNYISTKLFQAGVKGGLWCKTQLL